MTNSTRINEMWARLEAAHARDRARQATPAVPARAAELGDVYLWPPPNALGLDWVVVSDHPNDAELVFVVPADGHPLSGLADVAVRDAGSEPLYLRCGRGLWVRRADLPPERRYRALGPHHLRRAQEKVRQIAAGPLGGASSAWEDEANPDYHAWMTEVTEAVLEYPGRTRREPLALTRADFRSIEQFRTPQTEAPALAAADGLTPAAERDRDDRVAYLLPAPGSGELLLVLEGSGVRVVFRSLESAAAPPVFAADAEGEWREADWSFTPKRRGADALLPWVGDRVQLRVGTPGDHQEYTIARP